MRISDWSSDVCSSDLGATPIAQMVYRIQFAKDRYEGQFTPPTAGYGNLGYPAFDGIIDWHGATIDPTRRLLIANASYIPFTYRMMKTQEAIDKGHIQPWAGWESGKAPPPAEPWWNPQYGDRTSGGEGKRGSIRVDMGGR